MKNFQNDLSQGNVTRQLLKFSLPFLLSNLIQSLYAVADMIIVGRFAGTVSMSGVNIGSQISFIITNMVFGLCVGATVLIAQYLGAAKKKELEQTIGTLFTALLFLAAVLTFLILILRDPILMLIKTPVESYSKAKDYFTVTMTGIVFIFGYNALSSIMRGMGDSKNPLIFVSIACFINIALDLLFVAVFNMAARGAAIATVISQAVSMILCIVYLKKNDFIFDFKLTSLGIHKERLKMILRIGFPSSIQNLTVGFSFLFLTTLVNIIGVTASAAVGAVGKLNTFAILPAVAMSSSISAMSAQNIGAGEEQRAIDTMKIGMLIATTISAVIFLLVRFFPEPLLRIFSDDNDMVNHGVTYMRSFSFDYFIVPFLFCMHGFFIGSGHTIFTLINSTMSSLLFRIPTAYLLGTILDKGLFGVGLAAPIASSFALVAAVVFFLSGKWRKSVTGIQKDAEFTVSA